MRCEYPERLVANLIAMAIRTVKHGRTPAVLDPRNGRQFVRHPGSQNKPPCKTLTARCKVEAEAPSDGLGTHDLARQNFGSGVATKLMAGVAHDCHRRASVLS
jgi:hypothetical protein